jgi:hypothetical protein
MTTAVPQTPFADAVPAQRLERAAAALTAHGFTVEILDDATAARARVKDLIPEGATVFTGASETLRLSGIDEDTALRRVEEHCLPLEHERAMKVYGQPGALNRLLILNAEPHPGRGTVLLLREAIGF